MLNKNKLTGLCIIITLVLLAVPVFANVLLPYETAAVSRIVGDDPSEMIKQLDTQQSEANIDKYVIASGYTNTISLNIRDLINDSEGFTGNKGLWSDLKKELNAIQDQNPFIIIHSHGDIQNRENVAYMDFIFRAMGIGLQASETSEWQNAFENRKPLVLFDADYAGLYLPGFTSYVGMLGQDSTFIAPTNVADKQFDLAILCNLEKYHTIGELYKQARNNYYWGTSSPSGLSLMSYQLLGNPFFKYSASGLDENATAELCASLDKEYSIASASNTDEFTITSTQNNYEKQYEIELGAHSTPDFGNITLVEVEDAEQRYEFGELVLPQKIIIEKFPLNTMIKNYSAITFEDPVEITLNKAGIWMGYLQEATCTDEKQQKKVTFSHAYTEDSILEVITINPVDVINCSEGKIKLYKTIKFSIEYLPYSPIQINSVDYPIEMLPEQKTNITIDITNLKDSPAQGYFVLKQGDSTKFVLPVNTTRDKYDLELTAPKQEGKYTYRIDFYENNESKTYTEFNILVDVLEANLIIPEIAHEDVDLTIEITNKLDSNIATNLEYYVSHDGTETAQGKKSIQIKPGQNTFKIELEDLDRTKEYYDILVNIPYLGSNKVATGVIITNYPPVIIQDTIIINENKSFSINPEIYDIDDDDFTTDIEYPFEDYDEDWVASFEHSGEYDITITADDGMKETEKDVKLIIVNTNRAPAIHQIDTITIKENETFTIEPNATDPDNENSVSNDDNNLTFYYASLFDENGTWTPDFDKAGNYTVQATVTDGEYYDDTFATIIVLNTNRPPVIDTNDTMTVNEGDLITLDMLAYDPDNKNNVTNDDNELSVKVTAPLDENATWQTTDEDSGNYTITITVSDGEYNTTKDVTITVQNINRAPEIDGLNDIAVKEGETVQLTPIITDLDNQNNVTNDDNQITITYPAPFNQNGTWHTTYEDSGEYNITVRVSDGITETTQNIIVYVANTNRLPQIQPLPDINTTEGQTITITPTISDPDNQNSVANDDNQLTVTYSEIIPAEGTLELDYESSGEHTITATVSDGELKATTSFKLKIDNVNRAPQVNVEDLHVKEGQTIDYTELIFDPDNENNVENDDNNLIVNIPLQFEDGIWEVSYEESGTYNFNIWAYDGEFNTSEAITITVDNVNRPPTLEEISDITAYEGETIQINAVYSDPDNENSVTNDDNTLRITYSPPLDNQGRWVTDFFSAGTYDMTATVSDGHERIVERFTITVQNQNRLPSIDSYEPETTVTINEGESQTFKVNVKDPDLETPELTWYLDGQQASTETEYEYTPSYTDEGTHEIKVIAKDSSGGDAEHTWTVHVDNVNRAPDVQEIGILRVPEGDEAIITIEATDADEDELTYSINDERFTQNNNVFTWQTTYQDAGAFDVEITVSDGQEEAKQTIKIIVANFNHAPEIIDYSPKQTKYIPHNKDFEFSITAFDADNETLIIAWYVNEEIKGTGESFTFNAEGKLKEFKIEAKVTDGNATAKQEFNIESTDRPKTDSFDEETTDLSEYSEEELASISGFTLQKGNAKIKFLEDVDLSYTTDLENNVLLENSRIALNTPELPALNKPARITFYNVHFTQNPVIYYSEGFAADAEDVCPPSICYDIKYENNVLSFTAAHFTTYIIRETPFKQYHLQAPEKITLDAGETETDFTIRNSGLLDIKNLEITSMFNKGSFVMTPTRLDLEKGDTETIKIEGTVQRPSKAGRTEIGSITLQNKDVSQTIPVYLELEEKLNIGRLEINVGDKTYSNAEDKDKIKAKPGSHIELEFMIENNIDEKITIEDVVITAETDDDYDESDYFDITAGNYKTKILEIDLPRMLDENRYDLVITVEGEDEKGTEYETEWTLKLKIDKEKHDTNIENLEISPAELKCDKETRIAFDLVNFGTTDEENLKIDIQNKELDIDIQDYVNIQEASDTEFRYRIIFDDYQKAKQHAIPVNIYYDDGQLADSKELMLSVLACGAATTTDNPETIIKIQATTKLDNSKPVLKNKGDDTFTLTAMLLILLALLLILAGLLFLKAVY